VHSALPPALTLSGGKGIGVSMKVELRDRYFQLLDIQRGSVSHKAALTRAHELRKFEIENYWKRSTYFWGFQLVAFAALALAAKDGRFQPPFVVIVSVLGFLTAFGGALTARGSKFWQANWEAHVDFLEDELEGLLHKTALVRKRLSFSVSRVNEGLLEALCFGWFAAFVAGAATVLWPCLMKLPTGTAKYLQVGIPLAVLILCAGWIGIGRRSQLRGRAYRTSDLAPYDC
jgi:hypothetical protein